MFAVFKKRKLQYPIFIEVHIPANLKIGISATWLDIQQPPQQLRHQELDTPFL
jgi:hypothetical protein